MREFKTREGWLSAAAKKMLPLIQQNGHRDFDVPRVSLGFGPRTGLKALGSCTMRDCAADRQPQIFISPLLKVDVDSLASDQGVLSTLLHEMCHAALPDHAGHGSKFRKLAAAVGLEEPWTATTAGPDLLPFLRELAEELGPFPHSVLSFEGKKTQTTRMIKCDCPDCGYVCRTTREWLGKLGAPICPGCKEQMEHD